MVSDKIKYLFPKLSNRIRLYRNRLWKHCDVERIAMRGYKPFENTLAFKSRIHEMLGQYDINILVGISDEDEKNIITCANKALRHEFDLLGSGPVVLNPIDWHTDFKANVRWDKKFYQEIRGIKGADIKVPWELSRCQHLLWLGEAFMLTHKGKYAQEVIDEIGWWIDDNPLMYSVNWKCAMDVAFRAVNWIFALNMISDYPGYEDTFSEKVSRSLWKHGFFIYNNLEREIPYSNNHYASDVAGLLYIGELFGETKKGKRWLRLALKEYEKEIRKQVLPSGVHYERSVSYHRMMTEMLSYPVYMLNRMGEKIPTDIKKSIGKMYAYIAAYTKPNGLSPLIADNDDGRFAPFFKRDFRKHNYLNDSRSIENRIVSVGLQPLFCKMGEEENFYTDAGIAILKRVDDYLLINNSGYSKCPKDSDYIIPTHTHNDQLSFELCFEGKDIIVDTGTYLYTSSEKDRNEFRSTQKHNTIVVDDEEQNGFNTAFSMKRNVIIGNLCESEDGGFEGDYTTIDGKMHHKRVFNFTKSQLVLKDLIKKGGVGHHVCLFFHFAPGLKPSVVESSLVIDGIDISIDFSVKPRSVDIKDDFYSPSYGVLTPNKVAVIDFLFDEEISIVTTIKKIGYYE